MAKVFITGSADGLGKMAAGFLLDEGHEVVLHARNDERAAQALKQNPAASACLVADLSSMSETMQLAAQVNSMGRFDAVIHNAAIGYREQKKVLTRDGLPEVFAVNSLAPYLLTAMIERPKRLVYISSSLHHQGDARVDDLNWQKRSWSGYQAYADSKLHNMLLCFAVARKWSDVYSNVLEPGWVATKMGGAGAPDDLAQGFETQAWLCTSEEAAAKVSGWYFYHKRIRQHNKIADDVDLQEAFMEACQEMTGIKFPAGLSDCAP